MKVHRFERIVVYRAVTLTLADWDDIYTGESDGSGIITVRAVDASASELGVEFYQVEVEVEGAYELWTKDAIRSEARAMLERDYTSGG